jgi:hypothetical protein
MAAGGRRMTDAERFFAVLAADLPRDHTVALWTKAGKRSRYSRSAADAAAVAAQAGSDVYVGVGFLAPGAGRQIGQKRRPSAGQVAGLFGLWLDLDVNGTPDGRGGTKTGAAPDREAAIAAASAIATPTLLVDSGGGVHAWWLFDQPWVFADEDERLQAASLAQRWQDAHRSRVRFSIDSTHDLARLLRVPGTLNAKGDPPAPVALISDDGSRFALADLDSFVADVATRTSAISHAAVVLNGKGSVPADKFEALFENNPKFVATWNRARPDFGDDDSRYDLSIASMTVAAGWADDEIAAAMRDHRRTHSPSDPKLDRDDYYARTIAKARAQDGASSSNEAAPTTTAVVVEDGEERDALEYVRKRLDLPTFRRTIKRGSEDAIYDLELEDGTLIRVGFIGDLRSPSKVADAIGDKLGFLPPHYTPGKFRPIANALLAVAVTVDDSTPNDETRAWLTEFFEAKIGNGASFDLEDDDDRATVVGGRGGDDGFDRPLPAFRAVDGRMYVRLESLDDYLHRQLRKRISRKEIAARLGRLGFEKQTINGRRSKRGQKVPTPRFWISPADFDVEASDDDAE